MRNRARSSKGGVTTAESGVTSMPTVGMEGRKQVHQVQSAAVTVSSSSSQASVSTNNVGAKEIGFIESVQEDSEMGMDGAHSLVVDSGLTCVCVPRVMPLTRLCSHCRNAGEDWTSDQRAARCSRFG